MASPLKRNVLLLILSILIVGTIAAQATALLVGTTLPTTSGSGAEYMVGCCCFLEQAFTLTSAVQVTNIAVQMSGFGTDLFTLWLTNAIGPGTTTANVLFQTPLTFPNTGGGVTGSTVSIATNLFLSPGSYFLVENSAQMSVAQGWLNTFTTIPTLFGSVGSAGDSCCASGSSTNTSFPPGSTFSSPVLLPLAFQISGAPVPEPGTLVMFGSGFLGLVAVLRRKLML
jgi:hypothetical protein